MKREERVNNSKPVSMSVDLSSPSFSKDLKTAINSPNVNSLSFINSHLLSSNNASQITEQLKNTQHITSLDFSKPTLVEDNLKVLLRLVQKNRFITDFKTKSSFAQTSSLIRKIQRQIEANKILNRDIVNLKKRLDALPVQKLNALLAKKIDNKAIAANEIEELIISYSAAYQVLNAVNDEQARFYQLVYGQDIASLKSDYKDKSVQLKILYQANELRIKADLLGKTDQGAQEAAKKYANLFWDKTTEAVNNPRNDKGAYRSEMNKKLVKAHKSAISDHRGIKRILAKIGHYLDQLLARVKHQDPQGYRSFFHPKTNTERMLDNIEHSLNEYAPAAGAPRQ